MAFFSIIKSESDWLTIEGDNMTNHPTFGDKLEMLITRRAMVFMLLFQTKTRLKSF